MPELDALFHRLHRRRTKGEERIFIYEGTDEVGRKDKYLERYVGKEYGPDEEPREVLTMTMQTAFHPIYGKEYLKDLAGAKDGDTELLD